MRPPNCGPIAGEAGICLAWPRAIDAVGVERGMSWCSLVFMTRVFDWTLKKDSFQVPRNAQGSKSRTGARFCPLIYFNRMADQGLAEARAVVSIHWFVCSVMIVLSACRWSF